MQIVAAMCAGLIFGVFVSLILGIGIMIYLRFRKAHPYMDDDEDSGWYDETMEK